MEKKNVCIYTFWTVLLTKDETKFEANDSVLKEIGDCTEPLGSIREGMETNWTHWDKAMTPYNNWR